MGQRVDRFLARRIPAKPYILRPSRPVVSFTFDDFPRSALTVGGNVLGENGVAGTFYACAGLSGETFEGLQQFRMSDISELVAAGHELGCHTYSHINCQSETVSEFARDCGENAKSFSEHLGDRQLVNFAYPYGCVDLGSKKFVSQHFATGRGVRAGLNVGLCDLSELRAYALYESRMDGVVLKTIIQTAVDKCAWLVFYTHDVAESPGPFGCSLATLERAVKTALDAGCTVLPMRHALAEAVFGQKKSTLN